MKGTLRTVGPLLALVGFAACGGGSTPPGVTNPTPTPTPQPSWSLGGAVVDAVSGAPIPGASLAFSTVNQTQTSGAMARWTLTGTGTATTRQAVTVSASGYLTYETGIRWEQAGRRDIQLALIPDRRRSRLAFYREFVRNGIETPASLRALARWTTTPNFYVNTFNPKTGQPLEPAEVDLVVQAIRAAVPQLTGGQFNAGVIETGQRRRSRRGRDYINMSRSSTSRRRVLRPGVRRGANPGRDHHQLRPLRECLRQLESDARNHHSRGRSCHGLLAYLRAGRDEPDARSQLRQRRLLERGTAARARRLPASARQRRPRSRSRELLERDDRRVAHGDLPAVGVSRPVTRRRSA